MSEREQRGMEDGELQDPDQWDFDSAEEVRPERRARAVVSVAFSGKDLAVVTEAARTRGVRLSQFIREAALEKAAHQSTVAIAGRTLVVTSSRWAPAVELGDLESGLSSAPELTTA